MESIGPKKIPNLLVSEYLPGPELTIDTIVNNGSVVDCLIRTRSKINNGISVAGSFIRNDAVYKYIVK